VSTAEQATPLWTPSPERVRSSNVARFAERVGIDGGYEALHRWSIAEPASFWAACWEEVGLGHPPTGAAVEPAADMPGTRFFPGARLNVAEVILSGRGAPAAEAMFIAVGEDGSERTVSRAEVRSEVAKVAAALRAEGVGAGDRVAAWLPNVPETMVLMLAAASIGAVFSSTSPDFGVDGVLDRFGQIEPTVLVACEGYSYGGRWFDRTPELAKVRDGLPSVRRVVTLGDDWGAWTDRDAGEPEFEQLPFDHPWYVLYSSGTTGVPKCIVHRAGGVLLQHLKEHQLQCDIRPGDRVAYYTTCGWMMWNWLASVPASGATAVLYEGSPFHPGPQALWDLAERLRLTFLGVSAKFIESVRKVGYRPADHHRVDHLRTLASTGSPLSVESFGWVYEAVRSDLHLASISGGTDLCGCFVCGDPTSPVYAGEIQRPSLGMAVDVWREDRTPAEVGERGELVCVEPFPSMPLGFWGDETGERYRAAYFERFPGVWAHGDFASWTPHGGVVIHGRSDTTLNPGGIRIGTAEIYRQVEQIPEVVESLVFGQEWEGATRIVLLLRLAEGAELTDDLVAEVKQRIRTGCTPRHVPAVVLAVDDLPRTRSNKLAELAVSDAVNGRPVRNTTALSNPEAIDAIVALPELSARTR
jgi:acetoacetyl-CoA synthetase